MATILKHTKKPFLVFFVCIFTLYPLLDTSAAARVAGNNGAGAYYVPAGYYDNKGNQVPSGTAGSKYYTSGYFDAQNGTEVRPAVSAQTGQYSSFAQAQYGQTGQNGGAFGSAAAQTVGCGAGQVLAGVLRNGISSVVAGIKGAVTGEVASRLDPTKLPTVSTEGINTESAVARTADKEFAVGSQRSAVNAVSNIIPDAPGLDAIGFCLANAAVHYVAQSTINWINSGFNGSPTFIQNPQQFFMDAADQEAGGFIEELGLGFMCTGFAPKVRIALVNDWNNRTGGGDAYRRRSQCTLTNTINNVERVSQSLSKGQLGDFVEYVGNPANRANSNYLMAQDELNRRVTLRQSTLNFELRTSDFLPFKKCQTLPTGNGGATKQVCNTYSPGTVIQNQLESTLNLPKGRLAIADEFDEVITSLINQLIKTALSESLNPVEGTYGSDAKNSDSNNNDNQDNKDNTDTPINTPNVPTPIRLKAVCTTSATSTFVGNTVTLNVDATGGNASKGYVFSWQGIEGATATTTSPSLNIEFTEPATSSVISVLVTSGSKKTTATCPAIEVKAPEPIVASCAPDKTSAAVGEPVTWEATATGGNGTYQILWSGSETLAGQITSPATVSYVETGRKTGAAKISSGGQSVDITCSSKVKVN